MKNFVLDPAQLVVHDDDLDEMRVRRERRQEQQSPTCEGSRWYNLQPLLAAHCQQVRDGLGSVRRAGKDRGRGNQARETEAGEGKTSWGREGEEGGCRLEERRREGRKGRKRGWSKKSSSS
eukprot:768392-Hanusia_phi.AAC.5